MSHNQSEIGIHHYLYVMLCNAASQESNELIQRRGHYQQLKGGCTELQGEYNFSLVIWFGS